jgi:hypothetical protein
VPKSTVRAGVAPRKPLPELRDNVFTDQRDRAHRWAISPDLLTARCGDCGATSRTVFGKGTDGRLVARVERHGPARCPKALWWAPLWDARYHGAKPPAEPPPPWEAPAARAKGGAR